MSHTVFPDHKNTVGDGVFDFTLEFCIIRAVLSLFCHKGSIHMVFFALENTAHNGVIANCMFLDATPGLCCAATIRTPEKSCESNR